MTLTFEEFNAQLEEIVQQATSGLDSLSTSNDLAAWEREYFGSAGSLTVLMKTLGSLDRDARPVAGRLANQAKTELSQLFADRKQTVAAAEGASKIAQESVDVTLPGRPPMLGYPHPVSVMIEEISEIFAYLGFQTIFGPEVETGHYNFDLLNIPADHPARDVWDTVFVDVPDTEIVMRTHTSPMQARVMEQTEPPVRVIVPGRVYRYESQDASHEWMFHQIEGLAVDETITMADLKGVLQELARQLFGPERRIRFRCDFFPFVEPGVDFAVDCAICNGKGCRVCKQSGWLEMGGAGMVHPNVLSGVGIDPLRYTGFAFGLGVERMLMMKYSINDVRVFAESDTRFLESFAHAAR